MLLGFLNLDFFKTALSAFALSEISDANVKLNTTDYHEFEMRFDPSDERHRR
jgi:hypothetical protein